MTGVIGKQGSDVDDPDPRLYDMRQADKDALVELESQNIRVYKKTQETTRTNAKALRTIGYNPRSKAMQSIQHHISRIQTGSSLETMDRNPGALSALTQS